MAKILQSVEFIFEDSKVAFVGGTIVIMKYDGDGWQVVAERPNKWVGKNREDDGVMGRAYKPRVTDALRILRTKH